MASAAAVERTVRSRIPATRERTAERPFAGAPWLGGLEINTLIESMSERLSDTYQIPVWVNDGKLSHAPRLVFESILTWDALPGQLCRSECSVNGIHV